MNIRLLIALLLTLSLTVPAAVISQEKTAAVEGTWEITLTFVSGTAKHTAVITQKNASLSGTYRGEIKEGRLQGSVKGNAVDFTGRLKNEALTVNFHYTGLVTGDTMKGTVEMGEFWTAEWTAKKVK
jgi:D-glucosaminate-6-phosphate ammonia-lyase